MKKTHKTYRLHSGYIAPSTAGTNIEIPTLSIGDTSASLTIVDVEAFFPSKITLRAHYRTQKIAHGYSPNVTMILQGKVLDRTNLYDRDVNPPVEPEDLARTSTYTDLFLVYDRVGVFQREGINYPLKGSRTDNFQISFLPGLGRAYLPLLPHLTDFTKPYAGLPYRFPSPEKPQPPKENFHVVYVKPFSCEMRRDIEEHVTRGTDGQFHISPPGKYSVRVLHPYGGYYKPGLSAEEYRQVYYELGHHGEKTVASLTFDTTQANTVFDPPIPLEHSLSLGGALSAGFAKIIVHAGGEQKTYTSTSYQHPGEHMGLIDVTFVPSKK